MRLRVLSPAAALALLGAPVAALVPPYTVCDNADGSVAEFVITYEADDLRYPGLTEFYVNYMDAERSVRVLAHCGTRKAVAITQPGSDAVRRVLETVEAETRPTTLRQLAQRLKRAGAKAVYGKLPEDHCACRPETHRLHY